MHPHARKTVRRVVCAASWGQNHLHFLRPRNVGMQNHQILLRKSLRLMHGKTLVKKSNATWEDMKGTQDQTCCGQRDAALKPRNYEKTTKHLGSREVVECGWIQLFRFQVFSNYWISIWKSISSHFLESFRISILTDAHQGAPNTQRFILISR